MDCIETAISSQGSAIDTSQWLSSSCQSLVLDLGCSLDSSTIPSDLQTVLDHASTETATDIPALLDLLSRLISVEGVSELITRHFWPIVTELLARWIGVNGIAMDEWERRLRAVVAICGSTRGMWDIATAFIDTSPFASSPLAQFSVEHLPSIPSDRLHILLIAYYRILLADGNISSRLSWPHGPLHILRTQHPDTGVRLLAIRILSMQRPWSEAKRIEMETQCVGDVQVVDAKMLFGFEAVKLGEGGFVVKRKVIDGWLLPVMERRRLKSVESFLAAQTASPLHMLLPHLSSRVVPIGDRLFLRASTLSSTSLPFIHVPTSSSESALLDIVPLLQQGLPLLVSSTPSSGKTHLLQHLSTLLHPGVNPAHRILSIPLADTTIDVKSLIGTYISSPTKPGTFEWMEGALAKAVRAGRWVILDDIDRASVEMLVTVAGIARSLQPGRPGRRAKLVVPGREEIEAGDGFALFATRSVRPDASNPLTFFGHHLFSNVGLSPPGDDEVLAILSAKFQALPASVSATLVRMWQELRPMARVSGPVKAREIGLRDLEKWCARVVRNLPAASTMAALEQTSAGVFANPVFQDEVLLEAVDTFMASLDSKPSSIERRNAMIAVVATAIGMDEERAFALVDKRKPALEKVSTSKQLIIGRTSTPLAPAAKRRSTQTSRPFALTKPSLILLERIAASSAMGEPTLLVGETGTGKTTAVQYIADTCGKPLTALNLSMQTESSDLLGGFKPVDASVAARLLHAKWQKLFCETFSMTKQQNASFLEVAAKALTGRKWQRCAELWSTSARRAMEKLRRQDESGDSTPDPGHASPRKRRKPNLRAVKAAVQWQALIVEVSEFDLHHVKMNSKLVFSFVEGPLVKAMQSGEWILLDEINLASQETLEAISTILEGPSASLILTERGDVQPVTRHPDFRLFACMNPATDVGKKDLPPSLRSRFTEIYAAPPDDDREALVSIITQYIGDIAAGDRAAILDVAEMYQELKTLSATKEIVDGANTAPHYSMRTLARSLMFAIETAPLFGLRRAIWEGCLMAFTMSLDLVSIVRAREICSRYLLGPMKNAKAVLSQIPSLPSGADSDDYVRFGPFWLKRGPLPPSPESRYVITPSVQAKLSDLARVVMTHRYPVLIQGPTSSGKTSAVEFLARQTGHRFVRINNHEHTDIQEYLGTYVTDPKTGNLVFQEGLLVTAVRQGHWIVLDELNLAPTDVLEALNRLLDDNRELVIPETQEVVRPHPNFILFATQNPPGLYAGRKVLSRAFRNRFLEVHFDDVPKNELETIICQRCQIAPTYAKKIVQVFEELRHRRQASRVFESKQSFATLRDLFRWAERGAVGYLALGSDGYMLLAERGRQDEDKEVIKGVIEQVLKVSIDSQSIYDLSLETVMARLPFSDIPKSTLVWTKAMQRLFTLVASALANNEPVLLVGETGCGKTSVCDIIALAFKQNLVSVNCHQNMETADLLGSQRPVRNRLERKAKIIARIAALAPDLTIDTDGDLTSCFAELRRRIGVDQTVIQACEDDLARLSALFEWSDGPLVHAMQQGDLLLLDEVSLADDSVLERLNSVLEPGRTLVLAEKGGSDIDSATIVAHANFHVVATMNPGGDFGKKELSPALRNRFTEIWVPPLNDRNDLLQIIGLSWKDGALQPFGALILDFFDWFGKRVGDAAGLGLRDILAWVNFMNELFAQGGLQASEVFHHGGQMTVVDGLESLPQCSGMAAASMATLRSECLSTLSTLGARAGGKGTAFIQTPPILEASSTSVRIGAFGIPRGSENTSKVQFHFNAPTTALNAMRVLRASQLPKAILLEGSPGVGKTSLVTALAAVSGFNLQRINLSDQTDLIDLFGSDLPVEGGKAGEFRWRDAAFLDAMQKGDWVLLDEMNLASQTVLEGLNAVLDYRGTVYIPELGRSFARHPDFRVFAAQNPLQQGGGRKGLPKSFLNRFTKVYLQEQTADDLLIICQQIYPMPVETVQRLIAFNEEIRIATTVNRTIGREGSPWEFNLRDLFRWFGVLGARNGLESSTHPAEFLRMIYLQRFRNQADRNAVQAIFERVFAISMSHCRPMPYLTPGRVQIGHSSTDRASYAEAKSIVRHEHLDIAESLLKSVELGWLVILAGESGGGKRSLVRTMAGQAGRSLGEFTMHPGVDTSEILGSFEQQDHRRLLRTTYSALVELLDAAEDGPGYNGPARSEIIEAYNNSIGGTDGSGNTLATLLVAIRHLPATAQTASIEHSLSLIASLDTNSTGFAWADGQLIDALRHGGWYLISDANLCSPSVLDRLNSLCESNGCLILSEKGSASGVPEIIQPHPDFRLFMTYDPRYGELSRAMRNRGIELYIQPSASSSHTPLSETATLSDSLLRASTFVEDIDGNSAAAVANGVAGNLRASLPHLTRLTGSISDVDHGLLSPAVAWARENTVDLASGPSGDAILIDAELAADGQVFRSILIHLRIHAALGRLQDWVTLHGASKTILAQSAATSGGRKSKRSMPGAGIHALIVEMRKRLQVRLAGGGAETRQQLEGIDRVEVLLHHLEERCKSDTFDYSAVGIIAEGLEIELKALPGAEELEQLVTRSIQHVQTTTGRGQSEIWSAFRSAFEVKQAIPADLLRMADKCRDSKLRQMLLKGLTAMQESAEEAGAVEALTLMLEGVANVDAQEPASRWTQWPLINLVELHAGFTEETLREEDLALILSDETVPVSSLIPIASAHLPPGIDHFKWMSSWLGRIWDSSPGEQSGEALDGPACFFGPAQLVGTLRFDSSDDLRLDQIADADNALAFSVRAALWSTHTSQARSMVLVDFALEAIRQLLSAFGIGIGIAETTETRSRALTYAIEATTCAHIRQSGQRHLVNHLHEIATGAVTISAIGKLFVGISQFTLEVYVTSVPMDPAVRRVLSHEVLISRLSRLNEELQAVEAAEIRSKGLSDSLRRSGVLAKISEVESLISNLGPSIPRTSDPARLAYLFNEVHSFLDDVHSGASIDGLVSSLASCDSQALHREQSFQLAGASFLTRLSSVYADMDDLVQPIITAVLFSRFGIRSLARALEQRQARSNPVVEAALVFPRAAIIPQLQDIMLRSNASASDLLIASFSHAAETGNSTQRNAQMETILVYVDGLYSRWSETRMREQHEEQAKESLYRVKKTDVEVLSDLEQEEQEFSEMFPQYEADEDGNVTLPRRADDIEEGEMTGGGFPKSAVESFHELITALFGINHGTSVSQQLSGLLRHTIRSTFDHRGYNEGLDTKSLSWQIETLHRRLAESRKPSQTPNFYLGANEPESRKAAAIASRLRRRLDILISEWPEQMILQHIRDRCDRFLSLDIRSPVAMTLTNLEQLLIHIDDWEPYASRDNSLKSHQAEISALLIDWRRLELSCWTRLLDDQTSQYVAKDAEWTLRLFGALISGSTSTTDLAKHFDSLVPMITTYLQTSTLGSFSSRVSVLDCFRRMASELSTLSGSGNLTAVHALLSNIVNNARLFTARFNDSVRTQRAVIDKAIKDFVKLASWKDVNVFALRASAQKSHKQLHRNIRKFRAVLQQPVAPMLSDLTFVVPQVSPELENISTSTTFVLSALPVGINLGIGPSTPAHLVRLSETLAKFTAVLETRSSGDIESVGGAVDAIAVDIIETASELASATPASLTKENTKAVANLARRKRKAYSDLLKALRASGFSQSVRADALSRQQSSTLMLQRLPFRLDSLPAGFDSIVKAIEAYDTKLGVLLPALRAAFNGHHDDIASPDLQRGIGFTESIMATCLLQREKLLASIHTLSSAASKIAHIRQLARSSTIEGGREVFDRLVEANLQHCRLRQALIEAGESVKRHRELEEKSLAHGDVEGLQGLIAELDDLVPKLDQACASARASSYFVFSNTDSPLVLADDIRHRTIDFFTHQSVAQPMFDYLHEPLLAIVRRMPLFATEISQTTLSPDIQQQSNDLISAILVLAQSLPSSPEAPDNSDEPPHLPETYNKQVQLTESLRLPELLARLDSLMGTISDVSSGYSMPFGTLPLGQVLPFLETIGERYARTIAQHAYAVKSTYKLCYVVGRVMLDLAQKGFCKPLEESKSKDGEGEDTVEGTGMGTGTGDKNVSSEIEEEGQVEGLQGEKEEEEEDDDDEDGDDDDAVDMENDFEGDLGEGKEKKEDEGEDGSEEEEDHDEHAGDVDPLDPGAVDEKFWGEEDDKEGKDQGKDEVMEQSGQDDSGETEMTAKEEESKKKEEKKKEEKEAAETAEEKGEQQDQPEDGDVGDEGEDEDRENEQDENDANSPGRPDEPNVNVDEGDRLDLPEDINLDGDEESDNDMNADDDISLPPDERGEDEEMGEGDDASVASADDGAAEQEGPEATGVGEDDTEDQEEAVGQNVDLSAADEANAQDSADVGQGQGGSAEEQPKEKQEKEAQDEQVKEDVEPEESKPEGEGSAQDQSSGPADQQQGEGAIESSGAPIPSDAQSQPQPKRNLGDILEDIRRRKDEILAQQERSEEVQQRADGKEEAPGQVEYLQDGDMDEGKQALGAAGDEERQKLEDLNIIDDDMEGEAEGGPADEPESADDTAEGDRSNHQISEISGPPNQQDTEMALTRAEIKGSAQGPTPADEMDIDAPEGDDEVTTDLKEEEAVMDVEEAELVVLDQDLATGDADGESQWRYYASLTSDLSYALCEQLRLILEPTLATRLQGDFRTGKRLNMRKIVPYIASEYTKDKIWLRRTKPSRREYQVLLSLDDSRSMAESHSVDLAHQTLALVAQALNKLEVGQIAFAKFGERVDIIHPFGTGFTDADGAKVFNHFSFDQQKTDVAALVERTLTFLAEARQTQQSTSGDLWQLQIIVSDGICNDHHRLRTLLRRALEERVMIVFIVVDQLQNQPTAPTPANGGGKNQRPSILSMQTVEYKDVGGVMELEMTRYLDTFPFEYYVVLRDVAALPGVLSSVLRQWITRISQSNE